MLLDERLMLLELLDIEGVELLLEIFGDELLLVLEEDELLFAGA